MSILRYYKIIESYEFAQDNEVLAIMRNTRFSSSGFNYNYIFCILAPCRNHGEWCLWHKRFQNLGFV